MTMGEFRPMRRFKQQLSQEECEQILDEAKRGTLAVLGDGGYPYAIPINFARDGSRLLFHGAKAGHKMDAIEACDKASFAVHDDGVLQEGQWWYVVRSVICFGRIRRITDEDEILHALWALGGRFAPEDYIREEIEKDLAHVAILELEIEHMTGKRVNEK